MSSRTEAQPAADQRIQRMLRGSVLWIFSAVLSLGITLILSFNLVRGPQVSVTLNEPAPQDVVAPRSLTYASDVLTKRAQQQAASNVSDQYTSVNLSIGRAQNNSAQAVFSFVEVVRADALATQETKLDYVQAIENISVDRRVAEDLLAISQSEFAAVRDNVLIIIEDTMREGVLEDQLSEARRKAALGVRFNLTPAQERIVTAVAPQFIVPNIFYDEQATAERQEEARASVEPVVQVVTKDELIIRVGDVIDDEDVEMLEQLGLLQAETDLRRAGSAFIASALSVIVLTLYWNQFQINRRTAGRNLAMLAILLLLFILGAKLLVSGRTIYAYLFPAAALSMLLAVIFDIHLSLLATIVLSSLVGYIAQNSLELAVYSAVGGIIAVLTLRDTQRINALFRAGLVAAVGNVAVILVFRLPQGIEAAELLTLVLFGLINGPILSASLTLAGIFVFGGLFGITTLLQLQELSRLDHPLLQELLRRAPGTYHHSIMVANLAEQAAEYVDANSTLVRVGAFYHDVGKMTRPPFFIENQNGGNPHDSLDPYSSARIIISHVQDGLDLARKYRLPNRVRDFIAEHHGDRVIRVFYHKALETEGEDEVDISRFRYKGPRPRSRETGIVQLADSVEATSSALRPNTEEAIAKLVSTIVDDHLREGQLDDSGLTLGDIQVLKRSFIETLNGRFHTRIRYPGNEQISEPEPDSVVAQDGREVQEGRVAAEKETSEAGQETNGAAPSTEPVLGEVDAQV